MLATVYSSALQGIDALLVEVEIDLSFGIPGMTVVGLPAAAVRESTDGVRSALRSSGYDCPSRRITINLAPADVRKDGSAFDLPIALGLLAALGHMPAERLRQYAILGELSLDGRVKPVRGALPVAAALARSSLRGLLLPAASAAEAAVTGAIDVIPVDTLAAAGEFFCGARNIAPLRVQGAAMFADRRGWGLDFRAVRGEDPTVVV